MRVSTGRGHSPDFGRQESRLARREGRFDLIQEILADANVRQIKDSTHKRACPGANGRAHRPA